MVKIRVCEAAGAALDWLVAKCLGWLTYPTDSIEKGQWYHTNAAIAPCGFQHNRVHVTNFRPSTDWAQGGPIIEQEKIYCLPPKEYYRDVWVCTSLSGMVLMGGDTPLIAAMRCYVASKLGDEVEVPEELL